MWGGRCAPARSPTSIRTFAAPRRSRRGWRLGERRRPHRNLALVDALAEIAAEKGVTTAQLAIAWVLHRGDDIVPLVGARRRERLHEALGALDVELDDDDLARIEDAVPADAAAGARYAEPQMAQLDSER